MYKFLLAICLATLLHVGYSQGSTDYAVQTWTTISNSPASITVQWNEVNGATNYNIYRKLKSDLNWGAALASSDATVTSYVDTDVNIGESYEYKVEKIGNVTGFGYINAGINIPAVHFRGNLLLLVDSLMYQGLETEVAQLQEDLTGDGWYVITEKTYDFSTAIEVKDIILDYYENQPGQLTSVFCLGHVPVPYAGNYAADGHANNHEGAWPSDTYYGEIDGNWTDATANNTTASQERTHNIPGDGKFDQTFLPSDVELQVGRVDFANMPAFALDEEGLLRQYLNKSHAYKMGEIDVQMQAIIDDNFGGFNGEAFAASGWKNFGPLLHPDNVASADYRTSMDTASYIWSYGCGGGSYTSCSGIGNTNNIAGDSLKGVFSALFGSYFGDWDSQNNIMRATLGQGTILTNCWSGRPHWYFHHMGLGENIGYSTKISMNNNGVIYNTPLQFLSRLNSMGLMGDPSLRMYTMSPASNFLAEFVDTDMLLSWTASEGTDVGYYLYRLDPEANQYILLNEEPIVTTTYVDACIPESGSYEYMVRATKLQLTPSGSFHNLSQGRFATADALVTLPQANFTANVSMSDVELVNNSTNANTWAWNFGDNGTSTEFEPTHTYAQSGDYNITLVASNICFDAEITATVSVVVSSINNLQNELNLSIYPNPVDDVIMLTSVKSLVEAQITIVNMQGQVVLKTTFGDGIIDLDKKDVSISAGTYYLQVKHGEKLSVLPFVKM